MRQYVKQLLLAGVVVCSTPLYAEDVASPVVFELKNGDRITAIIQSQDENGVVALTSFGSTVTIPLDQIVKQSPVPTEEAPAEAAPAAEPAPAAPPAPAPAAAPEVEAKSAPRTFMGKFVSNFHGEVQVGMDAGFGASDYMNYYGRAKATHGFDRWKSIWDAKLTYGKNKDVVSADKLDTSYRLEYDAIPKKLFVYGEPTGGYDSVRSIDYYYTIGGGAGYHVLKMDKMALDFSAGASFQSYHYENENARNDMYIDFGENYSWEIVKDLLLTQKLTFSPKAEDWGVYRMTFEAGLSWAFYKNMTFNFTLIDKYDSNPANNVDKNDLQIVSSIGLKF